MSVLNYTTIYICLYQASKLNINNNNLKCIYQSNIYFFKYQFQNIFSYFEKYLFLNFYKIFTYLE